MDFNSVSNYDRVECAERRRGGADYRGRVLDRARLSALFHFHEGVVDVRVAALLAASPVETRLPSRHKLAVH